MPTGVPTVTGGRLREGQGRAGPVSAGVGLGRRVPGPAIRDDGPRLQPATRRPDRERSLDDYAWGVVSTCRAVGVLLSSP